jgi:hypothetical protein
MARTHGKRREGAYPLAGAEELLAGGLELAGEGRHEVEGGGGEHGGTLLVDGSQDLNAVGLEGPVDVVRQVPLRLSTTEYICYKAVCL